MRHRALLASLSLPRWSRCGRCGRRTPGSARRRTGAGEGSLGAEPSGLPPALTSSCPAVSTPTPRRAMRRGAAAATSAASWESRSSISAWRACQRRAECGLGGGGWILERAGTVGCAGPDPLPRRQLAQRGADRFWGGSDDGVDLGAGLDSGLMPPRRGRRGPSRPGRPALRRSRCRARKDGTG